MSKKSHVPLTKLMILKSGLWLFLCCTLLLTCAGCNRDRKYLNQQKPYFRGTIQELNDDRLTVRITVSNHPSLMSVSNVTVDISPSYGNIANKKLQCGDTICVYYAPEKLWISQSYATLHAAYAIYLITPTGRPINIRYYH